jgi:hypothetical protein
VTNFDEDEEFISMIAQTTGETAIGNMPQQKISNGSSGNSNSTGNF